MRSAAALLAVLFLAAVRFHAFLFGGVVFRRDAPFFFVPWRVLAMRLSRDGFPFWADAMSSGRAFAADPNAAVFWPLTPLVFAVGPTGLVLANIAAALVLFFLALRLAGLTPFASAAGTTVLLFSGVFQSLPGWFGMLAAAAPLPLAAVCFAHSEWKRVALGAAALGLSLFGGEPAATAIGGVACAAVVAGAAVKNLSAGDRRGAGRRCAYGLAGLLLAAGLSGVQLLPAAGELGRSARGTDMAPEHGILFWSVRPARLLTLLEPRLVGDPYAEEDADYWGAGTFDAGNPYFDDLALGVVPLVLAALAVSDRRGRAALLLGGLGAIFSFGRFLPGFALVARPLSIFRYPEKWWLLVTYGIAAAAAVAIDRLQRRFDDRGRLLRRLRLSALALAGPLSVLALLALLAPQTLRAFMWAVGLGAGTTPAGRVARALLSPLLLGVLGLLALAALAFLAERGRLRLSALALCAAALFFADAARRVAGTCPAAPHDFYEKQTPALSCVEREGVRGRFYDDHADLPEVAARRAREAEGFDPLRPVTGVLHGIRYAGENDIDRMTPAVSVRWAVDTARLPWGEEKLARLETAGVAVVRTDASAPDPPGAVEVGRFGGDRVLRLAATRPEFDLLPEAWTVARGEPAALSAARSRPDYDPHRVALVEGGLRAGTRLRFGSGSVSVLERRPSFTRLRISAGPQGGVLAVARTFDPSWKATLDGSAPLALRRAEGFLTAAFLPPGEHAVTLRYENPLFLRGLILSAASALTLMALALFPRGRR